MLQRYLVFNGRIGRGEFWLAVAKAVLVIMLAMVAVMILGWAGLGTLVDIRPVMDTSGELDMVASGFVPVLIAFGLLNALWLFCLVPACIRRRHDRGSSGRDVWLLVGLQAFMIASAVFPVPDMFWSAMETVSSVGSLYLFVVLGLLPGERGSNRYGQDPRAHGQPTLGSAPPI